MKQTFTVTEDHLKLLSKMDVSWGSCAFGAPAIDCKRPYGNSDILSDIAEVLDFPYKADEYGEFTEEQEQVMRKLHKETRRVLQIVLVTGKFETGKYEASEYGYDWEKIL